MVFEEKLRTARALIDICRRQATHEALANPNHAVLLGLFRERMAEMAALPIDPLILDTPNDAAVMIISQINRIAQHMTAKLPEGGKVEVTIKVTLPEEENA